jgi:hypothetical protein
VCRRKDERAGKRRFVLALSQDTAPLAPRQRQHVP